MTDNKLADALRDIQQYLQMTAPSPDCGHLLQITVDALAAHDAKGAAPDAPAPVQGVACDAAAVERALTYLAFQEDGAQWPDAYSKDEQDMEREKMRGVLAAANNTSGPGAYCRACQSVGMRNCQHFDECSGATCITCHRSLNTHPPVPAQPPAPEPQGGVDAFHEVRGLYEFAAIKHGRNGDNAIDVDAYGNQLDAMFATALKHPQATNETRVTDEAQSEKWIPVKPHGAPYYGIHTESGATIAGTASGLGERDAKHICALHNGELCEADDLIRALGFEPERFRTECGFINHHKLAAAIKHPDAYTGLALKAAPQPAEPVAVDALLKRAYEVVHHDQDCPSIGGNGDNDCRCDAVPFLRDLEKFIAARLAQPATIHALDVFKIAGGDVECSPEPTAEMALDCLRDLRQCYEEVLSQQPAAALPEVSDEDVQVSLLTMSNGVHITREGEVHAALESYRASLMTKGVPND